MDLAKNKDLFYHNINASFKNGYQGNILGKPNRNYKNGNDRMEKTKIR